MKPMVYSTISAQATARACMDNSVSEEIPSRHEAERPHFTKINHSNISGGFENAQLEEKEI